MSKKKKNWLDNLLHFGESHPVRLIVYLLLLGGGIELFIQSGYWIGRWKGIVTDYSAGDVLGFWGSFLAFIGTFILGAIALWQNKKVNDINERLLGIEEAKLYPMVDISLCEGLNVFTDGKVKSTKGVIMIDLDHKVCQITGNNEIENAHDDLTWIFECENTSEVKIIKLEIGKMKIIYNYINGEQDIFTPKTIGYSGDECLKPHESKPLIISGIKFFSHENLDFSIQSVKMSSSILCANAVGDFYKQQIDLDVACFPLESKVSFPGVFDKKYSKPKKVLPLYKR